MPFSRPSNGFLSHSEQHIKSLPGLQDVTWFYLWLPLHLTLFQPHWPLCFSTNTRCSFSPEWLWVCHSLYLRHLHVFSLPQAGLCSKVFPERPSPTTLSKIAPCVTFHPLTPSCIDHSTYPYLTLYIWLFSTSPIKHNLHESRDFVLFTAIPTAPRAAASL